MFFKRLKSKEFSLKPALSKPTRGSSKQKWKMEIYFYQPRHTHLGAIGLNSRTKIQKRDKGPACNQVFNGLLL